jgi:hypothetical protein
MTSGLYRIEINSFLFPIFGRQGKTLIGTIRSICSSAIGGRRDLIQLLLQSVDPPQRTASSN